MYISEVRPLLIAMEGCQIPLVIAVIKDNESDDAEQKIGVEWEQHLFKVPSEFSPISVTGKNSLKAQIPKIDVLPPPDPTFEHDFQRSPHTS